MTLVTVVSPQGTQCTVAASLAGKLQRLGWQVTGELPEPEPETLEEEPEQEEPEPEQTDGAPQGNASRGEWAAYAESLGLDVDGLKRNEIRDLVEGQ